MLWRRCFQCILRLYDSLLKLDHRWMRQPTYWNQLDPGFTGQPNTSTHSIQEWPTLLYTWLWNEPHSRAQPKGQLIEWIGEEQVLQRIALHTAHTWKSQGQKGIYLCWDLDIDTSNVVQSRTALHMDAVYVCLPHATEAILMQLQRWIRKEQLDWIILDSIPRWGMHTSTGLDDSVSPWKYAHWINAHIRELAHALLHSSTTLILLQPICSDVDQENLEWRLDSSGFALEVMSSMQILFQEPAANIRGALHDHIEQYQATLHIRRKRRLEGL